MQPAHHSRASLAQRAHFLQARRPHLGEEGGGGVGQDKVHYVGLRCASPSVRRGPAPCHATITLCKNKCCKDKPCKAPP